jgi:dipeptidyl aminopeptidase/acylaminoacyl peptidase
LVARYSNELQVTARTPPTFLIHSADDDAVPVENSLRFYRALVAHDVPVEMHLYPYGGHGYALAVGRGHLQGWPARAADWLASLNQP